METCRSNLIKINLINCHKPMPGNKNENKVIGRKTGRKSPKMEKARKISLSKQNGAGKQCNFLMIMIIKQ